MQNKEDKYQPDEEKESISQKTIKYLKSRQTGFIALLTTNTTRNT